VRLVVNVEGGKFNAPLCNSSCRVAVVDDVLQWSVAHNCDFVVIEVVHKLAGTYEYFVCQFLVVRVALLGFRQDLTNVVDWSLYTILLHFFLAFHHDDDADDPVGCHHVE
jgi:hypothetical protein